jgi:type IV pilus assembly protein PilM
VTEGIPGTFVGLDIGATGLRAASVAWDDSTASYRVERVATIDLPPGVVVNGAPREAKPFVSALRKLWRQGRFTTRRTVFGVADSGLLTRQVDLPWMPPEDFASALRYQVADVLPVDPATATLGYHVIAELPADPSAGRDTEMNRILLVAGDRQAVLDVSTLLRKAGLEPKQADATSFGLIRAMCRGRLSASDGVQAIVDLGADHLTMAIHQAGQPLFLRTIGNIGGAQATTAIAERLSIDAMEAEQLKQATGLNGPPPLVAPLAESSVFGALPSVALPERDQRTESVIAIVNPWATTVVSEIRNSLDYFRSSQPGRTVERLSLTGRSMDLTGLPERIATEIAVPVEQPDAFAGLPTASRAEHHRPSDTRLLAAIGLAMGRPR